ncbi:peptide-methionine (R)-S-oxide reductase [Catalinimonas alkaloidigena]|uniref:peptide-methionine (R)-S-oxide reductase n=2 Tax=Catalinimonas alkaloidigena TaxID=1075417 RepID=A0A1G9M524_9BACT|nr:peptide-methionine (R)-S-oxide reductase [Catalinimonas alkaloidigena]
MLFLMLLGGTSLTSCAQEKTQGTATAEAQTVAMAGDDQPFKVQKTRAEWKAALTPNQFRILREEGTEPPYKNAYWDNHEAGLYQCAGCGNVLFSSETKYESHTGWPSFWEPIDPGAVGTEVDNSLMMSRTEVHCADCGGHLGHVFRDGPKPTGLRYCMNSGAMTFEKSK